MDELTAFSLRIPKSLAANIAKTAKQLGISKSEYARRALEEFYEHLMQERMAKLSKKLATQSLEAARSMDTSATDGLS
jgi:hypothetical protein